MSEYTPGKRMIQIITGVAGLPETTVEKYRQLCEDRGVDLSHYPIQETNNATVSKNTAPARPDQCAFRGNEIRKVKCRPCRGSREVSVFKCDLFGECSKHNHMLMTETRNGTKKMQACATCDMLGTVKPERKRPAKDWEVLRDNWSGAGVFLYLGGPSLSILDLNKVETPGLMTASTNQVGAYHRTDFHFSVDPPKKFHESIWLDPRVIKFYRKDQARHQIRKKVGIEDFETICQARETPNSYSFGKPAPLYFDKGFDAHEFMKSRDVYWGGADTTGRVKNRRTVSVMLVAIKILYELGFRRIYLCGADFSMSPAKSYFYDGVNKRAKACTENNNSYGVLSRWFTQAEPVFRNHGLFVYNCTIGGNLHTFERLALEEAIDRERALAGLYHLNPKQAPDVKGYYGERGNE